MWLFVSRMFMDTPEDEKTKLISCLGAFRQFWGGLPPVSTAFGTHSADDVGALLFIVFTLTLMLLLACSPGRARDVGISVYLSVLVSICSSLRSSSGEAYVGKPS